MSGLEWGQGAGQGMARQEQATRLRTNAKRLRKDMTGAERRLWNVLRAHRLEGIGFRRQMPIAGYIVDFAAPAHRVIVELDGSQHGEINGLRADRRRDLRLEELGWTVLRFWNVDVMNELDGVCRRILVECQSKGTGHEPSGAIRENGHE
jgi:very-short-patch-repair endonuclease